MCWQTTGRSRPLVYTRRTAAEGASPPDSLRWVKGRGWNAIRSQPDLWELLPWERQWLRGGRTSCLLVSPTRWKIITNSPFLLELEQRVDIKLLAVGLRSLYIVSDLFTAHLKMALIILIGFLNTILLSLLFYSLIICSTLYALLYLFIYYL